MAEKISTRHATAAVASAQLGDVIPLVRDVSGTPATGTATLQQVANLIAANTSLGGLSNVDLTTVAPSSGDVLVFDGANWVPKDKINDQTGTTYTLAASDHLKLVVLDNASAITLTVPNTLFAGFNCALLQKGTGQVTVQGDGTLTVNNADGHTKLSGQYATGGVMVYGPDLAVLSGYTAA